MSAGQQNMSTYPDGAEGHGGLDNLKVIGKTPLVD